MRKFWRNPLLWVIGAVLVTNGVQFVLNDSLYGPLGYIPDEDYCPNEPEIIEEPVIPQNFPPIVPLVIEEVPRDPVVMPSSLGIDLEEFKRAVTGKHNILIPFTQKMVSKDDIGKYITDGSITVSPKLEGRFKWHDTDTIKFMPKKKLPMCSNFHFTINPDLISRNGSSFAVPFKLPFYTPELILKKFAQVGATDKQAEVMISFNDKVSSTELKDYLTIVIEDYLTAGIEKNATAKQVDFGTAYSSELGFSMLIEPGIISDEHTVKLYNVDSGDVLFAEIRQGLRGQSGPRTIVETSSDGITIDNQLKIKRTYLCSDTPDHIHVITNNGITAEQLEKHISIPSASNISVRSTSSNTNMKIYGNFLPGKSYPLMVSKGLKANNSTTLKSNYTETHSFPDLDSKIKFTESGNYIQLHGSMLMPVKSVNQNRAHVTLYKIHDNNISHYLTGADDYDVGNTYQYAQKLCSTSYELNTPKNEWATTYLDIKEMTKGVPGIYHVSMGGYYHDERCGYDNDRILFISDIGLSAKQSDNDLFIWANSLSSNTAVTNAQVSVYTFQNQLIYSGTTAGDGTIRFERKVTDEEPFAITVTKGDDIAVMTFNKTALDKANFKTGGKKYLTKGYEAFIYSDRGIYRPGETVHLESIIRGVKHALPGSFPVQFTVRRPDGVLAKKESVTISDNGHAGLSIDLPDEARTGEYTASLSIPGNDSLEATYRFKVEMFVPDTIKLTLKPDRKKYTPADIVYIDVDAEHLFGAKAAGLKLKTKYAFVPVDFSHPDYKGYSFNDSKREARQRNFTHAPEILDADGKTRLGIPLYDHLKNAVTDYNISICSTVSEPGARSVSAYTTRRIHTQPYYVGVARENETFASPGNAESFKLCTIKPNGEKVLTVEQEFVAVLYKQTTSWVLKDVNGYKRWEVNYSEKQVSEQAVNSGLDKFVVTPPKAGEYRLVVTTANGISSDITFECHDGYNSSISKSRPDRLEITQDKKQYKVGETARVIVKSPFAGTAMLTVETDRVVKHIPFTMDGQMKELDIPITKEFGNSFYFAVSVLRDLKTNHPLATNRAFGMVPVSVEYVANKLKPEIKVQSDIEPGQELPISITTRPGTAVTIAVVDEGICQLTNFVTPDPFASFFTKRAHNVNAYDIYSMMLKDTDRLKVGEDSVFGGGGFFNGDARMLNPIQSERFKSVALWSGVLTADENGKTDHTFTVPSHFIGRLRVMAVADTNDSFGSAQSSTKVVQPIVIKPSFPRFLAPSDTFETPVRVFNMTGKVSDIKVTLSTGSEGSIQSQTVALADGQEKLVLFNSTAPTTLGVVKYTVTATSGDDKSQFTYELPVRPIMPLTALTGSGTITDSTSFSFPSNWVEGTDKTQLCLAPLPALKYANAMKYVMDYPYGCIEQTTSRTFPLLYLGDLAQMASDKTINRGDITKFVEHGIQRILSMQLSNGGFSMWPDGTYAYEWGSIYATHFLVEAGHAGYKVPAQQVGNAIDYLNSLLSREWRSGGCDLSPMHEKYALYTMALAGSADRSWAMRLYELDDEMNEPSRAQLAVIMKKLGKHSLATELLDMKRPVVSKSKELSGSLKSSIRDAAIMLHCYQEIAPNHANVAKLIRRLNSGIDNGRWGSTQENGWALLALGSYTKRTQSSNDYTASVTIDGEEVATVAHTSRVKLSPENAAGKKVDIKFDGKGKLYYFWSMSGIPKTKEIEDFDNKVTVRRTIYNTDHTKADLNNLKSGEQYIVKLKINSEQVYENMTISDLLPAGLEICLNEIPKEFQAKQEDDENDEELELEIETGSIFDDLEIDTIDQDIEHQEIQVPIDADKIDLLDDTSIDDIIGSTSEEEEEEEGTSRSEKPIETDEDIRNTNRDWIDYIDRRDDRYLVFGTSTDENYYVCYYTVRAVTKGTFALPPVSALNQYDESISSLNGAGQITVK